MSVTSGITSYEITKEIALVENVGVAVKIGEQKKDYVV